MAEILMIRCTLYRYRDTDDSLHHICISICISYEQVFLDSGYNSFSKVLKLISNAKLKGERTDTGTGLVELYGH